MHPRIVTTLEEEEEEEYVFQLCGISRAAQWTTDEPLSAKMHTSMVGDIWRSAAAAATHGRGEEASFRATEILA